MRELFGGARAPRIVYVPHGFSEKRQDWARETAFQDVLGVTIFLSLATLLLHWLT